MAPLLWNDQKTIDILENELRKGNVILGEGDTVLGLLADVSQQGRLQLDLIKSRSEKPYLILVHDSKKAFKFIQFDESKLFQIENLMNICWPGPVTIIFRAKNDIPDFMKASHGTIALRVPHHQGLLQLLERCDALFSTSANSAGKPVPSTVEQVDEHILHSVRSIVLNNIGETPESALLPSTIIDCTGDQLVVVRQGAFPADLLIRAFN